MRFVWSTPVAFAVIGIGFAFGFFAAAYIQVMPAFAKGVLAAGAGGAGLLIAATGIGAPCIDAFPLGVLADASSWPISTTTRATIFFFVIIVLGLWRPALRKLRV